MQKSIPIDIVENRSIFMGRSESGVFDVDLFGRGAMEISSLSRILSKRLLMGLLASGTVMGLYAGSGYVLADQAEERQRDVFDIETRDLYEQGTNQTFQEELRFQRIIEQKKIADQHLKAMAEGLDPKVPRTNASKVVDSLLGENAIVTLNFGNRSDVLKTFDLGPYGLEGATPVSMEVTSREKGFFERVSSSVGNFYRDTVSYLSGKSETFAKVRLYFQNWGIQSDVLKEFKSDIRNDQYERAAVDELLRLGLDKGLLNAIVILDNQTENPIMKVNFYNQGMFSGTVEKAMSSEFLSSIGFYFEEVPVGALNAPQAVRKLNLQATSPFIEEQRRAYALYRYGID